MMVEPKSSGRTRLIVLIVGVIVVTAGTALALWAWFGGPNTRRYEPIVQSLTSGEFANTPTGRIDLAQQFPGVTPQNEMFVTRRGDGSFMAMFPTFYGKGQTIGGLVYTSRPLRVEDTYIRKSGTSLDRPYIDVGPWNKLSVDARVNEHWYRVSRGIR
jgi:hypothetical protein